LGESNKDWRFLFKSETQDVVEEDNIIIRYIIGAAEKMGQQESEDDSKQRFFWLMEICIIYMQGTLGATPDAEHMR
jgi:hypothetical protein